MEAQTLLIGNWKLNHGKKSAQAFLQEVLPQVEKFSNVDLAIAPVSLHLDFLLTQTKNAKLRIGAQNLFYEDKGAYTGECSAPQLKELGASFAIIGHSERRKIFGETDEDVAKKTKACLEHGLMPVVCVGETLAERENQSHKERVAFQVSEVVKNLAQDAKLVFAYEPVWAIGTGKVAKLSDIEEMHELIKEKAQGRAFKILYGGSVNAQNIGEIAALSVVSGALVGGASLQSESFLSMVYELARAKE